MFNSQSYSKWQRMLMQLLPDNCQTRLVNMTLLIVGIFSSRSVYLSIIARKIPLRVQKWSIAKRFERFLDNDAVDVERWYHPWSAWLIQSASVGGVLHLVIDTTKVSAKCRLLIVGVAYHRRTLPLMWEWVEYPRGHCPARLQIALLKRLKALIGTEIEVSFVGDSEFGNVAVIRVLNRWGWQYSLRQKGRTLYQQAHDNNWQRIDRIKVKRGQCLWLGHIRLTQDQACPTHLVVYWKQGEKEPWYLATNCLSGLPCLRLYRRRVWIEEMFGDMKGHGFDLELSRLRTPKRLSRLTLAVCILYVWLVTTGEYVLQHDLNDEVDRTSRRDLSIFRLGWDWLERRFTFDDPIPILFRPNFCLVYGC